MRLSSCLLLTMLVASGTTRAASTASTGVCTEFHEEAQRLRKVGKLLDAREALKTCLVQSCPRLVVSDCTTWLEEVQSSMPSIVPIAVDERGATLSNLTVSIDKAAPARVAPGQAIDIDPGSHHFRFESPGLLPAESDVVVAIGQKNKEVAMTLRGATTAGGGAPYRTIGLVTLGIGVAALAAGGGFGADALAKQNASNCPMNVCSPHSNAGDLRAAGTAADLSTAFFIAGGVLAGTGLLTWILAPSSHPEHAARIQAAPLVSAGSGGLLLTGSW